LKQILAKLFPLIAAALMLLGCVKIPAGITPVENFEIDRYLGRWYEIARLDHSFERGLEQVSAEYSLRPDGGIKVVNRGYDPLKHIWKEAEGKALFVDHTWEGYLKVSFFGPFYGAYVIFELERKNYQYAYVSGPNKSYLWLLARAPEIGEPVKNDFVRRADELGFNSGELIWVNHKPN
jgi:apolipoprotein D and lipocalin family protein